MSDKDNRQDKFDLDMSPIRDFAREMDSFFNHSFRQMNSIFNLRPFWVDVEETDSDVIVKAELAGHTRDQIVIETHGNHLRIAIEDTDDIEVKDENQKQYRRSQSYRKMERSITLPFEIPEEETKASFENGLLKLTIPKQNSKRKFIDIDD